MINRPQRPAVFLDRDGTLIEHVHYLADPSRVRLLPGAARALVRLAEAGFARVIVTNQAAIGKGLLDVAGLGEIHRVLIAQLAAEGASVDAIEFCPACGSPGDRTTVEHPDRKPGPGMLLRATGALDIDLSRSWCVGDAVSDVWAGHHAGCRGSVLLSEGLTPAIAAELAGANYVVVSDIGQAAEYILNQKQTDG